MKIFKKVLLFLVLSLFFTTCYAEETTLSSGDSTEPIFLNSYDELNDVALDVGEGTSKAEREEYKAYYEQYREYLKEYYDVYEREESVKAKVISAEVPYDDYQIDYSTYSIAKYIIQKLQVEILEGEYIGQKVDIDFVLSVDSMDNMTLAEACVGDTIYVVPEIDDYGLLTASVSNSLSAIDRIGVLFIIAVILVIILIIYGGKKGFSTALVAILAVTFATVIIPNFAYLGFSIIAVGILEILCLIVTISVIQLGTTRNCLKSIGISAFLVFVAFLLILVFDAITRTRGIVFEFAAISDNIIQGNIDFSHLYFVISLIISATFITNTVCMAVKRIQRESSELFNDKIAATREVLPTNIIPLVVTALTLYVPNHLLLVSNKFPEAEIINSETFISELIRLLATIACIIVAVPFVSIKSFDFGKKYLKEADEENEEKEEIKEEVKEEVKAEK